MYIAWWFVTQYLVPNGQIHKRMNKETGETASVAINGTLVINYDNSRTWGEGEQDKGVQENVLNGQSVCLCVYSSSRGARNVLNGQCVSVCLFLFKWCKKCTQWPMCVCLSIPLQGVQEMYSMANVCLSVYSSSRGARKCTQWPACVCLSIPLQGVQENVLNGQRVSVFLSVCVSIPLFRGHKKMYSVNGQHVCVSLCPSMPWDNHNGWLGINHQITYLLTVSVYSSSGGVRKCTQWPVCVCLSVCLLLFRGHKKMYSMASMCVSLCVYSSSGGAWKSTQWPVCVCACVSIPLRGCKKMYSVANVSVCLFFSRGTRKCTQWPACICLSTCVSIYSSSGGARKCTQWPVCVCLSLPVSVCLCVSICLFLFWVPFAMLNQMVSCCHGKVSSPPQGLHAPQLLQMCRLVCLCLGLEYQWQFHMILKMWLNFVNMFTHTTEMLVLSAL